MESPLLTAKQVMEYLNISEPTFYRYLRNGHIPKGIKLGTGTRSSRWHIDDLNKHINKLRGVTATDLITGEETINENLLQQA